MDWNWLKTEYPFEQSIQEKRNVVLSVSFFASLIVVVLQPFGFSIIDQIVIFLGSLFIGILTLSINYIGFPYFFPTAFEESRWSISKAFLFLLYNFVIIGFYNHIFIVLVIKKNIIYLHSITDLTIILFRTIAIGIIAAFFLILIKYNFLARKHLQVSQDLNSEFKALLGREMMSESNHYISFHLENNEVLLGRDNIKYIVAEGNYVRFHLKNAEGISPKLYRATLKQMEESLKNYPEFFRCHRSFIINLNTVISSFGNSHGLSVKMTEEEIKIPVARPKIKSLKQNLEEIRNG